jgi:hypothetical protein
VWEELRYITRTEDPAGSVLFINLWSNDQRKREIADRLRQGSVDLSRVRGFTLPEVTKKIQLPAQPHYSSALESLAADPGQVIRREKVYAAQGPRTVTKKVDRLFHLGNASNVQLLVAAIKGWSSIKSLIKSFSQEPDGDASLPVTAVVIIEPNEDEGQLDHLQAFRNACPQVDVYIFHRPCEKWGVEVEGEVDPERWEDEFPALDECEFEPPEVIVDDLLIKGNIHVVAGRFEAYKTMGLIELADAILSERPAFDHFKVQHSYPIMFLCADMSPELFSDYAGPFSLRKHGSNFRVKKPKGSILHAVDSPVLQRAVHGHILILDTMLDFAKIKEAFQSGEWITFMQQLRELMTVHGCIAVIMTAHATKTGAKSNTIDPSEYLKDSVTFGGKIDVGIAFSKIDNSSQIFIERIKSRGFKKPLSFTIAVNDDDGNCNFDRGRFPVYLKPGEAGKKEDHTSKSKGGPKPNPKRDELTTQIKLFKDGGASWEEIEAKTGVSVSTAKRYFRESFDVPKGE